VTREELSSTLEKHLATAVDEVITNITTSCQCAPSPIMTQHPLGSTPSFPAAACWKINNLNPSAPSGYYWLRGTGGSSFRMYCDMSRSCGGVTGGWMQVAKINMNNSNDTCPEGLKLLTTPQRLCAMNIGGTGCSLMVYNTQTYVARPSAISRGHQMHSAPILVIVFSQLMTTMRMVLALRMDVIQGNTSGHLRLLFMRSPLSFVSTSVPALTSTIQQPSLSHLMWGVTISVTLPVKQHSNTNSTLMIPSGMDRAVVK